MRRGERGKGYKRESGTVRRPLPSWTPNGYEVPLRSPLNASPYTLRKQRTQNGLNVIAKPAPRDLSRQRFRSAPPTTGAQLRAQRRHHASIAVHQHESPECGGMPHSVYKRTTAPGFQQISHWVHRSNFFFSRTFALNASEFHLSSRPISFCQTCRRNIASMSGSKTVLPCKS